jgi:glutamate racemase
VTPQRPVGVFDSGVGGLSVLREIRRELPAEDLIYVADSGHAPYGDKTKEFIEARAIAILEFLKSQNSKAVVVACNTVTGTAVDLLRSRFDVPIVAIEPAVKPARSKTRSGVVGVMATTQTLASPRFSSLVRRHAADVQVLVQPCPGLVEQVEAGELASSSTRALVEQYVRPLVDKGADTIVLGCTHYPFLSAVIQEIAGPAVTVIDPAIAVAREVRRRLRVGRLLSPESRQGEERFFTTGSRKRAREVMAQLWTRNVDVEGVPPIESQSAS